MALFFSQLTIFLGGLSIKEYISVPHSFIWLILFLIYKNFIASYLWNLKILVLKVVIQLCLQLVSGISNCNLIYKEWKFMDFKNKSGKKWHLIYYKAANKKVKGMSTFLHKNLSITPLDHIQCNNLPKGVFGCEFKILVLFYQ